MIIRLVGLTIVCASILLGCASNQSTPTANLERIERKISDVPEGHVRMHIASTGITFMGKTVTYPEAQQELKEHQGGTVYCEIDKFLSTQELNLEELASTVIRSGGRFFYHQRAGAIDSLFYCTELREIPQGSGHLNG